VRPRGISRRRDPVYDLEFRPIPVVRNRTVTPDEARRRHFRKDSQIRVRHRQARELDGLRAGPGRDVDPCPLGISLLLLVGQSLGERGRAAIGEEVGERGGVGGAVLVEDWAGCGGGDGAVLGGPDVREVEEEAVDGGGEVLRGVGDVDDKAEAEGG